VILDVRIIFRTWCSAAVSVRRGRTHPHWLLWRSVQRQKIAEQPYKMKSMKFAEAAFPYLAFREHVYSEPSLALMFASHTVFGARVLCTNKCPTVISGHNDEEDGHQHRGQLIFLHFEMKHKFILIKFFVCVGSYWCDDSLGFRGHVFRGN